MSVSNSDGAARLRERFRFDGREARNLKVKAISEILVKGGRFLLFVAAVRLLGTEDFGRYAFAFTLGNILANGSDFGLQMHLSREVAQGSERSGAVLRQVMRAKGALTALMLLALVAIAFFYPRPSGDRALILAMGAASLAQSWAELWNYLFRGLQSLREEAWLNLLQTALALLLGLGLLGLGVGPLGLALGLLGAAMLTTGAAIALLARRGLFAGAEAAVGSARAAIASAAPIGVAILLSILYFRIDVLFLERMCGDSEVGRYGAAYRLLESLLFLPAIFLAALFPAFAERAAKSATEMRRLHAVTLRWMLVLSLAIVAGLELFAGLGLSLLFGPGYEGSIPILRALAPSLVFIFVNYALTHFLVALHGQKWNAVFALLCLALNCGLNLVLIPRLQGVGAALATVATEALLFLLCYWMVGRKLQEQAARLRTAT